MIKRLLLTFLGFVLLNGALWAEKIVVFHTSDTHGFYYPKEDEKGNTTGGFAALKSLVGKEKLPHLLLDSGDFLTDTLETKATKGLSSVQLMNAVGYNATTIGNHEFDFGDQRLLDVLPEFKFPVLAANIEMLPGSYTKNYLKEILPYKIFNTGKIKIAVIGIARAGVNHNMVKVTSAVSAIKKYLPEIEKQKPDFVIVLIHESVVPFKGKSINEIIAEQFDGRINLVLGGHMHRVIQNRKEGSVYIVESGHGLRGVSRIEIDTDTKAVKSQYINLDISKTGEDAAVKKLAESIRVKDKDTFITKSADLITKEPAQKTGCDDAPLVNFFADILKESQKTDIGIFNVFGIRADIFPGAVLERDIYEAVPFNENIYKITANGNFIKRFLISGVKQDRNIYAYSGLTAEYKIKNGKVKNVKIFINGEPLSNTKNYTIAVNSFIVKGRATAWMFDRLEEGAVQDTGKLARDIFIAELKKQAQISAPDSCRTERKK
ncbi:2'(,)3'-cyclic-nucleotide 2'-phosphodiesterase [Elusimicrobium posterum]|uniref:bifunctional metallophosphatase/5'-nucleotidase n=1 Tax=Elusimicrobium posterum TaxID=3116653 RepID=UPI003C777ED7